MRRLIFLSLNPIMQEVKIKQIKLPRIKLLGLIQKIVEKPNRSPLSLKSSL